MSNENQNDTPFERTTVPEQSARPQFQHTQTVQQQNEGIVNNMTTQVGAEIKSMFQNGTIQRGAMNLGHKAVMAGGAITVGAMFGSGLGWLALGAVGIEQASHKLFETYFTKESHNNTLCFAMQEIQLIMKMCKEQGIEFETLSMADIRMMHDKVSQIVQQGRMTRVDRYK